MLDLCLNIGPAGMNHNTILSFLHDVAFVPNDASAERGLVTFCGLDFGGLHGS